jgi:hypothetical protein
MQINYIETVILKSNFFKIKIYYQSKIKPVSSIKLLPSAADVAS